ncbi:MAG: hypothetical protein LBT95_09970 [Treponema sp.]|nr:hypothetical protein [Treponema sp.]
MGLLNSMPNPEMDRSRTLSPIPGSPPDMIRPPPGCLFSPRCVYAKKICALETPAYYSLGETRRSRCWLHDQNAPKPGNPFAGMGAKS